MVNRMNHILRKKICSIKFTAFIVALLMIFNIIFPATYAIAKTTTSFERSTKTVPLHDGHITLRDDGSFFVKMGAEECSIRVTEGRNKRTVYIKNEKNGITDKLIFDTKAGTVFSTYTGKTVKMKGSRDGSPDQSSQGGLLAQKKSEQKQREPTAVATNSTAVATVTTNPTAVAINSAAVATNSTAVATVTTNPDENVSGEIVRISWKQIRDSIGWLVHRAGLVGLLIGCSGGGSIALATFNAIGFILNKIGQFFLNETEHGIVVYYRTGAACHGIRNGLCIAGNKLISIRQY